jgi:hypothetical protein
MQRDVFTYYDDGLYKYFCQFRGHTRHGDSALFDRNQNIIYRHEWIDGRGVMA